MVGHDHIKEHKELLKDKIIIDAQNIVREQTDKVFKLFGE